MNDIQITQMHDWKDPEILEYKAPPGLTEETVRMISKNKKEPTWMLEKRLHALKMYQELKMPQWGPSIQQLELDKITYFQIPKSKQNAKTWEELPEDIKKTFEKLGIPEAEKKSLSGAGAQYESVILYHNIKKELEDQGVIFEDMDIALQKYPELVQKYFMTCVPVTLHKFTALHGAVWSGGCLTGDSKIFTANQGTKKIQDIKKGDIVFALNKNNHIEESIVLDKVYSGEKPVYEILAGGRTLEATENHQFLCLEKSPKKLNKHGKKWFTIWKPLSEIKKGELIAITKKLPIFGKQYTLPALELYKKNHYKQICSVPKETTEDLMWFLGLFVGDGNLYNPSIHQCYINIAEPDNTPIRNKIIKTIKRIFDYTIITKRKSSIVINSKALGYWLITLGFRGKAKTKRIPNWVYGLPINQRLSFLGGLFDSDGYLDTINQTLRIELSNKELIKDIKLLAISCGLYTNGKIVSRKRKPSYLKEEARFITSTSKSYSCRISGNILSIKLRNSQKIKKMKSWKKHTFDKYNTITGQNFTSITNTFLGFAPIKSKLSMGIKKVYDIQVHKNHNFVANGIIAHNSFIYVPKGVKVGMPLQAYFRMNAERGGQFEHTLIIVEEEAEIAYIEGCSAPQYSTSSLHAGCVEVIVKKKARARYSSVESWSKNTYNLNTKRATVEEDGIMEWIGGNLGSACTMLYPCTILKGDRSRTEHIAIAFAGKGQNQDTGAKIYHIGKNTTSHVTSKSISIDGGITSYRGIIHSTKSARNVKSAVECDALMIDNKSQSNTYPVIKVENDTTHIAHEATVGRISPEKIFYLTSRGIKEEDAKKLIVSGFIEPITKQLPMEYAVELNKLIELEMEGSLG